MTAGAMMSGTVSSNEFLILLPNPAYVLNLVVAGGCDVSTECGDAFSSAWPPVCSRQVRFKTLDMSFAFLVKEGVDWDEIGKISVFW